MQSFTGSFCTDHNEKEYRKREQQNISPKSEFIKEAASLCSLCVRKEVSGGCLAR